MINEVQDGQSRSFILQEIQAVSGVLLTEDDLIQVMKSFVAGQQDELPYMAVTLERKYYEAKREARMMKRPRPR